MFVGLMMMLMMMMICFSGMVDREALFSAGAIVTKALTIINL